ncbi:selection and upkeep of intraepithelial T-cells protein 1-like [Ornithorhynchus anatinus]|uniref:selection and upkeep of intraepithelial T-cells protein 1-like n=1 Tax=Ornithorhynchus anatinus TaxID=9258 RepID=UPI0019D4B0C2|nr:selection and upkeep of intraepithelial T-cells protein 1-like [Ornithorhynchus anatinus]
MSCHLNPKKSAEFMEVRWFLFQPSNVVHLYDSGVELFGEQMLIAGGLYLIWKHPRDKEKFLLELRQTLEELCCSK